MLREPEDVTQKCDSGGASAAPEDLEPQQPPASVSPPEPEPVLLERLPEIPFYKENPFWGAVSAFFTFFLGGMGFQMSGYSTTGTVLFWLALPWAVMAIWLTADALIAKRWTRIATEIVSVSVVAGIMWVVMYEMTPPAAVFHISGMQVAFNRQNANQLIANIYIQNDGGDFELSTYNANSLATDTTPEEDTKHLDDRWKALDELKRKGGAPEFKVLSKEQRWFTNFGATYTNEQIALFSEGKAKFYFLGYIEAREGAVTKTISYCGYVTGVDLDSIVQCPPSSARKRD